VAVRFADYIREIVVPSGIAPWLEEFIHNAAAQNAVLSAVGAEQAASIRHRLLQNLIADAERWLCTTVSVAEAAECLSVNEETVRRAIRAERLPAHRAGTRGRYRIERRHLATKRGMQYDPVADAQDIAKRRRSA
jgi:excisionase family DNA binding protein